MLDVIELLVAVPIVFLAWMALEAVVASRAEALVERIARDRRPPRS